MVRPQDCFMKAFLSAAAILLLTLYFAFNGGIEAQAPEQNSFRYEAIVIHHNQPRVEFRGQLSAEQIRKWFKSAYTVRGERIEIPKDAQIWGALVLTDGFEIQVMPFYHWANDNASLYCCQGFEFGKAPAFCTFEQSEKAFLKSMRARLENLK
jgi:hypothetical protein